LGQARVNRVCSDVPGSGLVLSIADCDCRVNVQNSWLPARAVRGAGEWEGITIGVLLSINGTGKISMSGCLLNLALEVVERVLGSCHTAVKLIVTAINRLGR
jgi:hypothetical protein